MEYQSYTRTIEKLKNMKWGEEKAIFSKEISYNWLFNTKWSALTSDTYMQTYIIKERGLWIWGVGTWYGVYGGKEKEKCVQFHFNFKYENKFKWDQIKNNDIKMVYK